MEIVRTLVRLFSYVFHGVLALFLIALTSLTLLGGEHNLQLQMLPWTGQALTWWLLGLSLVGLVTLFLALKGILRVLFLAWSAAVLFFIVRGYYLSPYLFGPGEFWKVNYLTLGAVIALVGAWFQLRSGAGRKGAY